MKAPTAIPSSRSRRTQETAGVDRIPFSATHTRDIPLAWAMRTIVWIMDLLK